MANEIIIILEKAPLGVLRKKFGRCAPSFQWKQSQSNGKTSVGANLLLLPENAESEPPSVECPISRQTLSKFRRGNTGALSRSSLSGDPI